MKKVYLTTDQIIDIVKPDEVFVKPGNYLQCLIKGKVSEFQIDFFAGLWYEFQTSGRADNPRETFIRWIKPNT